ncbi:MAG: hypothetical protein PHD72_04765 [Patescibacteria group bacterium]|nr:hypothetical protein [Patescibacteria group bacterium]
MQICKETPLLPSVLRRLKGEYVRWEAYRLTIQLSTDDEDLLSQLRNAPVSFWLKVKNIRTPTQNWVVDRSLGEEAIRVEFPEYSDKIAVGFIVTERNDGTMFKPAPDLELEVTRRLAVA